MFHLSKDRKKKLISLITLNDTLYKQEKRKRKSQRCHKIIRNTYVYEKKEEPLSEQQTFQRSSCIPDARDHIQETRQIFH